MGMMQKIFGRNKKPRATTPVESQRESYDEGIRIGRPSRYFGLLSPDEVGRVIPKSLTLAEIKNMSASQLLRSLISMSPDMDAAVTAFQTHVASQYRLKPDSDREGQIIQDFIDGTERGDVPFQVKFETAVYNRYVEGGLLAELYTDESGEFVDIALPSTFSLRYREVQDPVHGKYYQVGQGDVAENFIVLQDKGNPNPLVEWAPTKKFPDKPFGRSQIASNIFGTVSIMEITNMIMDYARGQARPGGVVSVPRGPLAAAGYQPQQVSEIAKKASDKIEAALDKGDISQLITVPVEVMFETFTALGRSNLDAVEMIVHMLEQQLRRGYKLPRALYGGTGERGGSFGEYGERVEWMAFDRIVQPERGTIAEVFKNLFRQILRAAGNMGECGIEFDATDLELERIQAQKFNIEYEGYSRLIQDQVVSPLEIRETVRKTNRNLAELEDEMVGLPLSPAVTPEEPAEPAANPGGATE